MTIGGKKVVAKGADKADLRSERRQDRRKGARAVKKGTFGVGVDDKSVEVEGKLVTKTNKRGGSKVKFKAKGNGVKINDKIVKRTNKDGEIVVKKDKKNTKYS